MRVTKNAAGSYIVTFSTGRQWDLIKVENGKWVAADEDQTRRSAVTFDPMATKREVLDVLAKIEADDVAAKQK